METIWKGSLGRGGRKVTLFSAELVEDAGEVHLIERNGIEVRRVSASEVRGDSWMLALSMEARKAKAKSK